MEKLPDIACARCGRRVDSVVVYEDKIRMVVVIVAKCHGETDRMDFSPYRDRELAVAMDAGTLSGVAFRAAPALAGKDE